MKFVIDHIDENILHELYYLTLCDFWNTVKCIIIIDRGMEMEFALLSIPAMVFFQAADRAELAISCPTGSVRVVH